MKISFNDVELFTLTPTQCQVLCDQIPTDVLEDDLKRRLQWVLMHKYERCFARLKQEWDAKLAANGVEMIPTNPDAYAQLVFAQPNYKDRQTRDLEAAALEQPQQ